MYNTCNVTIYTISHFKNKIKEHTHEFETIVNIYIIELEFSVHNENLINIKAKLKLNENIWKVKNLK